MCGRFSLDLPSSKSSFKKETIETNKDIFLFSNFNIAPTDWSPIIIKKLNNYVFQKSKWGFEFNWLPKGKTLFNIRTETIFEKSFSKDLIISNRCLVPFNHYFEWKKEENGKKIKYKLHSSEELSFFGAVYQKEGDDLTFSLLTKESNPITNFIHHRNPIIIAKKNITKWFTADFIDYFSNPEVNLVFNED